MLTDQELKNRQLYYQGYRQCLEDFFNILKEQEDETTNRIYINSESIESIKKSLDERILNTFEQGYMYYDENTKKFVYIDEEFQDEI